MNDSDVLIESYEEIELGRVVPWLYRWGTISPKSNIDDGEYGNTEQRKIIFFNELPYATYE